MLVKLVVQRLYWFHWLESFEWSNLRKVLGMNWLFVKRGELLLIQILIKVNLVFVLLEAFSHEVRNLIINGLNFVFG